MFEPIEKPSREPRKLRRLWPWLAGTIVLLLGLWGALQLQASLEATPVDELVDIGPITPRADGGFLRGMTVSCPIYGEIWGSPSMRESLRQLRDLGVEWVAIHPYAGVRRDGTIRFQAAASTGYLERAVTMAREEGIELFWKPHLAYWGSFDWRGDIAFGDDAAAWDRFFEGYRAFIVDQARFAESSGVKLFSLGIEYEKTTYHEARWRQILGAVREVYHGRLTYAANWDRLDAVPFWDALDLIGVQAYFPLYDGPEGERIDRAALIRGWRPHLDHLRELARRHGKPVLFAEIGYDLSPNAAREPWRTYSRNNSETRALRQELIRVALEEIEREPHITGMFWWKWMPDSGSSRTRDFPMRHPDAMELLRRAWSKPPPAL